MTDLIPSEYLVELVAPLGFRFEPAEPVNVYVPDCDNDMMDNNFNLFVVGDLTNKARPKGYWKHQFDVRQYDKVGYLAEEYLELPNLVETIKTRYRSRYEVDVFDYDNPDFYNYWYKVLNYQGTDMRENAKGHLATLLLNWARGYVHQAAVVTDDSS